MKRTSWVIVSLALIASLLLLLPLTAQGTIVDGGTDCPYSDTGAHVWRSGGTDKANCLHGIIEHYYCVNCGKTLTEEYGELGDHIFGDYQKINPTCTQEGGTRRVCTVCGYVEEMWELTPLGHDWQEEDQVPTCTQAGYQRSRCARCGEKGQETILPALGHDWPDSGWVTSYGGISPLPALLRDERCDQYSG